MALFARSSRTLNLAQSSSNLGPGSYLGHGDFGFKYLYFQPHPSPSSSFSSKVARNSSPSNAFIPGILTCLPQGPGQYFTGGHIEAAGGKSLQDARQPASKGERKL